MQKLSSAFIFSCCFLLFFLNLSWSDVLPEMPEHLATPFSGVEHHVNLNDAMQLHSLFENNNYTLDRVLQKSELPPIYVANLPPDLNKLSIPQKTSLFIRLLLTSVVDVNKEILAVRKELETLVSKKNKGIALNAKEEDWLKTVAGDHGGHHENLEDLLYRVDIIPVGLIMAQAIDESGWGTSHFAIEGNALYGQHLASHSQGAYLTTPGGHVKVAAFDNLYHSTASYIHNLNSTRAYDKLRSERAALRATHGQITGDHLAGSLIHYSERGQHYVDTLRWLIQHYKLDELNSIDFDHRSQAMLVSFER